MGILNFEDPTLGEGPKKPETVVDTRATTPVYEQSGNTQNLTVDIDGEPWAVEYYNQILSSGESPKPLDVNIDPTLQQYLHVTGFRLSVTEELSSDTDTQTGTTTVTGAGNVYPDTVIPHIGDMFVAKLETGFFGVFTLTSVTRATFYKRSSYSVEYRLFEQMDSVIKANLETKTVSNQYFDKYRLMAGVSPLVSYRAANLADRYIDNLRTAIDLLYLNFYDKDRQTFIFYEGEKSIYDPFAVAFFNNTIDTKRLDNYPSPKEYDVGIDNILKKPTLWRAILRGEGHGLDFLYPREFFPVDAGNLTTSYILSSIVHTRIDSVPMPEKWSGFTVDVTLGSYVLSHAFYDNDVINQSNLEKATHLLMEGKTVADSQVVNLSTEMETLTGSSQFYHLLLMAFILCTLLNEG